MHSMVRNKDLLRAEGSVDLNRFFAHDLRVAKTSMNQLKHKLSQKIYQ